jgi:sulfur carrier protein
MTVTLNGSVTDLPDDISIHTMLTQKGFVPQRVVVECDRVIIPRAQWQDTLVKNGAEVEVIAFVGGG